MIRFTEDGIFADTEDEKQVFYDRAVAGDPIIIAHLALYKKELTTPFIMPIRDKIGGRK